ncbi:MAG: hypothetical protein RMM06_01550 [Armatimonadota bacterium]|nr:hypothetical protein [bacterium]MCS7310142.1 hypothetical protein [Armatimonadota bacterium]MDW8105241.1 hypothetical protein [Armatimonadota bacterium]MDW8289381.1 hypothetical protein [Armatimonadota bacterium]
MALSASEIWAQGVDRMKDKIVLPSMWEALDHAVPITIENGEFVVGLPPQRFSLSGHLRNPGYRRTIEIILSELAGEELQLRIIEGTTLADWERTKQREAIAAASREQQYVQRRKQEELEQSWDALYERIVRAYSEQPYRQLPQGKAAYLHRALQMVQEAMQELYPQNGEADDLTERNLARVIDRIANNVGVPPAMVAYELLRLRGEGR